ncbi:MAG: hypothetical protein KDA32_01450 [Phycisphaerales bacterium]|nr:hypothetical protein [Phycisphaerales bacterium]
MSRNTLRINILASLFVVANSLPAEAQINRGRISRPSETVTRGVLTGGAFSGQRSSVLDNLSSRAQAGPSAFAVDLAGAGGTTAASNIGAFLALPDIVQFGELGVYQPGANRYGRTITDVGISGNRLWSVSGMDLATSRLLPLGGVPPQTPPMTNSLRAPDYGGSFFRQHFGLAAPEPPAGDAEALPMADHLERVNKQLVAADGELALEYFKRGTTLKEPKRMDFLAAAERKLRAARDGDREAYGASLLLAHVAMDRRQIFLAILHLDEALRRNPDMFSSLTRDTIAGYYGDRELLDQTVRAYTRIGENNPGLPGAFGLQAYALWLSGDITALNNVFKLSQQAERASGVGDAKTDRVRNALYAWYIKATAAAGSESK